MKFIKLTHMRAFSNQLTTRVPTMIVITKYLLVEQNSRKGLSSAYTISALFVALEIIKLSARLSNHS